MMPVRLSVMEVHWRIANLGFRFRSHFTAHCGRRAAAASVLLAGAVLLAVLLAGESSRAMLASARLTCLLVTDRVSMEGHSQDQGLGLSKLNYLLTDGHNGALRFHRHVIRCALARRGARRSPARVEVLTRLV